MTTTSPDTFTLTFNMPDAGAEPRTCALHPSDPLYPVMLFLYASLSTQDGTTVEARHPDGCEMPSGYVPMFLLDTANETVPGAPSAVPGLVRHYGPPVTTAGARAFHFDYSALDDWHGVIRNVLDALPEERRSAICTSCANAVAETFARHAEKIRHAFEHGTVHELLTVPDIGAALRAAFSILPEAETMGLLLHSCGAAPA